MRRNIIALVIVMIAAGCLSTGKPKEPALELLEAVITPEIEFRNADMSDVMEFVANSWHCVCDPWIQPAQIIKDDYVTYQFHVDKKTPHDTKKSIALIQEPKEPLFIRLEPKINLHAKNINCHDLLKRVVALANGTLKIEGNSVTVKVKVIKPTASQPNNKPSRTIDPF